MGIRLLVVLALGLGIAGALTPIRDAHALENPSSCSSLTPSPTPNTWYNPQTGVTVYSKPSGWGAQYGTWSWDGGAHTIAACNTENYYATYNGQESRDDYGATYQCVELIMRYAYTRWGDPVSGSSGTWSGDASNYWVSHPSHFTSKSNGSTYLPQVGDIIVYGSAYSDGTPRPGYTAGHVSIITGVNTGSSPSVTIFEQNWGTTSSQHTLQLKITSSGGSTYYTIGTDVGKPSTFGQGPGGSTYRWDTNHVIYGVLAGGGTPPPPSDPPAPTGTSNCVAVNGPNLSSNCDAPSVTILCGGSIGSTNDYSGIPINWTYTNGSTTCDKVQYSFGFNNGRTSCSFYLYVPNGYATSTIQATLSDGSHYSFYENPVSGWQYWFDATDITSLTFTDANGTTNQELGWGRASAHSIERICAF